MERHTTGADSRRVIHSGFAHFANEKAREQFLKVALKRDPTLQEHIHLAEGRPDVIFEDLSLEQLNCARLLVGTQGKWFDDVQFQTF